MTETNVKENDKKLLDNVSIKSTNLEVVFVLDITGSMGNQIEGVKKMISKFCETDRPGINVYIFTFTENSSGCYVTKSQRGLKSNDLVEYVNNIKLCCPPGILNVNASGGDGPENVTAAIYSLLEEFNDKDNVLSFVITDDTPHHKVFGQSSEARAEKRWLTEHNQQNQDVFYLLNEVAETLNITFVPVLFGTAKTNRWYHQAAVLSQGLVLAPKSTDATLLANGLGSILETMQQFSVTRSIDLSRIESTSQMCQGFTVVSPFNELEILAEDCSNQSLLTILVNEEGSVEGLKASILGLLETTFDRFSGKKATKRCRDINPDIILTSVKVLIYSMLDLTGSKLHRENNLNASINKLLEILETHKTDTSDHEMKLLNKFIKERENFREILVNKPTDFDLKFQPVKCLITLESAIDYLDGLQHEALTEADVFTWMEIVLQLTMCRLINVSFPLDINRKPDFADAWSSHIRHIEYSSVLTSSSAVKIRDFSTGVYIDPISRQENNAAVILAHPNDLILTLIYKCLTSLPSLHGLMQSYLISGGIKVFPSIVPGIQSSCLNHLLRQSAVKFLKDDSLKIGDKSTEMKQAEWEVGRCLLWSMRQSMSVSSRTVFKSLQDGKGLNPSDAIPKLIAGIVSYLNPKKLDSDQIKDLLLKLFEEMSADFVSFVNRKLSEKDNSESSKPSQIYDCLIPDNEFVFAFIPTEKEFSPCEKLHIAEKTVKKSVPLPKEGFEKLENLLKATKGFKYITSVFFSLCNLFEFDLKMEDLEKSKETSEKKISTLFSVDELAKIFMESFILKKRTCRYTLNSEKEWNRLVNQSELDCKIKDSVLDLINEFYRPVFKEWNSERLKFAKNKLIEDAMSIEESSIEECSAKLSQLSITVAGEKFSLKRADALDAIELIPKDSVKMKSLGAAFCLGSWTGEPPSQLRRHCLTICEKFENFPELKEELRKKLNQRCVCNRETPNRHGHHRLNQYPGATNWSQEYEKERLTSKNNEKIIKTLEKMKNFTVLLQELNKSVPKTDLGSKIVNKLTCFEYELSDYDEVKKMIDKIKDSSFKDKIVLDNNDLIQKINETNRFIKLKKFLN